MLKFTRTRNFTIGALVSIVLGMATGIYLYYNSAGGNLISASPAYNADTTFNAVIEIPAGTQAKWEVSKESGKLELESVNGKPRIINYIAYPFNYAFI